MWAPSCYHGSVGHGWKVVERYISGQKERKEGKGERYGYEKTGAMPVVMVDEEKGKTHKTESITLYTKLFK
ncbi:MAG: hypothetical protein J7K81_08935 [Methanophagales archaeon]|nr:hypothetical protein [Methanophagales archaeon]